MRLSNPTNRNTQARRLDTDKLSLFFSYETCIAFSTTSGKRGRLANTWGPTTGRHINELGVRDYPVMSEATFHRVLEKIL